ncbi:MAG: endopeptidase La [bacterium]
MFLSRKKEDVDYLTLTMLPLRDLVVYPHMVVPLYVGRSRSVKALEEAEKNGQPIFLVAQKEAEIDDPTPDNLYTVGTVSNIIQLIKLRDNTIKVLVEGVKRAKIVSYETNTDLFRVFLEEVVEPDIDSNEGEELVKQLIAKFEHFVKKTGKISGEMSVAVMDTDPVGRVADMVSSHLLINVTEKQEILETFNPVERLQKLIDIVGREEDGYEINKKIQGRVKHQIEKSHREYYLNEQMKAINRELGTKDEHKQELEEISRKIKEARMPREAEEKGLKEVKRLSQMPPMSAEGTVIQGYLDWLLALPWNKRTQEKNDLSEAEKTLDRDHYGLKKVKERIIEFLAVRQLVKKSQGPILCLVGPPGVGKTSLARSVAEAMGRNFVRLSLGGMRDEAEIRGHRRTYVGAMPGRIVQYLKKAKSMNPVFLLDEIDKMSSDFRGDPASALLEVLDPEQNGAFNDHYLEVDFDLSEVMFITTANSRYNIPGPLLDRLEVISLYGYTDDEKQNIASRFLVPEVMKEHGLSSGNLSFSHKVYNKIIRRYTREAGVRNLKREISTICRKVAKKVVKEGQNTSIAITSRNLDQYLGVPKFKDKLVEETDQVGLSTGLAWTEVGGEILNIEVSFTAGKGSLTITGQLGEVMKESAQASMSYVRSRAKWLELPHNFYQKIDIHIHVPEGATPKDGPSAGITMTTALVSALTGRPVFRDIAMTGEVTLRGRVLPIGGLKEKVLAARRSGIRKVIIPKDNEKDLSEIPANVKKIMTFFPVEHMDEVLKLALHKQANETDHSILFDILAAKEDAQTPRKYPEPVTAH